MAGATKTESQKRKTIKRADRTHCVVSLSLGFISRRMRWPSVANSNPKSPLICIILIPSSNVWLEVSEHNVSATQHVSS